MQRSFSHILLITWIIILSACKSYISTSHVETNNLIVSESINELDSQLVEIYLPYKILLEKDMSKVISKTSEEMVKGKPESNLTNFLSDLLLEEGKKVAKTKNMDLKPDISYFNYGGIRTYLPKGEITVGKIYELMPFENEMVYLKLNGSQVKKFLNTIAEKGGDSLGGVRFTISDEKATNIVINGNAVETDKNFWLVTNDYVAAGGDNLDVLTERSELVKSGNKIRDVIIRHLTDLHQNNVIIDVQPDGRISYE